MLRQFLLVSLATLSACNPASDDAKEQSKATAPAQPQKPKRPAYCFFKSNELKAWTASVDAQGNVVVAGKAHMKDARYRPQLGKGEVSGNSAVISPTITQNSSYASPDNWWDVDATIPGSAAVTSVTILCGAKTVAELAVKRIS